MLEAKTPLRRLAHYPGNWKERPGLFFQDVLVYRKEGNDREIPAGDGGGGSDAMEQLVNKGLFVMGEPEAAQPRTIVVVGPARSGTSMVAGALHHLGLFMGTSAVDPVFEDQDLSRAMDGWNADGGAAARRIVAAYDREHEAWGWKRPSAVGYLERTHGILRRPHYIITFKDIFSISNRNRISMKSDILANMRRNHREYGQVLDFLERFRPPALLVSYEKALRFKEELVEALAGFCGLAPTPDAVRKVLDFVSPDRPQYLDLTRITKARGRVEAVTADHVIGWAAGVHHDRVVEVEIRVNGRPAGTVRADIDREDLAGVPGLERRNVGFRFTFPEGTRPVPGDTVTARVADEVSDLEGSPWVLAGDGDRPGEDADPAAGEGPVAVLVLGMHRSGTSMVGNLLARAGFDPGPPDELLAADEFNAKGYFEWRAVVELNDEILRRAGGSWHQPPEEAAVAAAGETVRERQGAILRRFGGRRFFLKDPRFCLTLPAWKPAFEAVLGRDRLRVVRIRRDPLSVARSLKRTHRLPVGKGLDLVEVYDTRADRHREGYPAFDLHYEALLGPGREGVLRRLGAFLEVSGDLVEAAREVIDPGLCHHDDRPEVSIVIPVFNRLELTIQCLDHLRRHSREVRAEVIVVDNASTDPTPDYLATLSGEPLFKVIRNERNLGFARACNQGAKAASAPYVLFLNNDTEPGPGWLSPLLEVLDADPSVAAVGAKLLFPEGTLQHAGVLVVDNHQREHRLSPIHNYYGLPGDFPDANVARTYQVLTAACLAIRREAFEAAGGFDEGYWNGFEDVDLCLRLGEAGHRLVYEPRSVVVHKESQSGAERFAKEGQNLKRLVERWRDKACYDAVILRDGRFVPTDAGRVAPYRIPDESGEASADREAPGGASLGYVPQYGMAETRTTAAAGGRRPPRAARPERPRVAVLSNCGREEACSHIRIVSPFQAHAWQVEAGWAMLRQGNEVRISRDILEAADAVIVQRLFPSEGSKPVLDWVFASGKPVIYDIDDLFFDLPESNPHHREVQAHLPYVEDVLRRARVVTVSTPLLGERLARFNANVRVVPNRVDGKAWRPRPARREGPVRVGYAGTPTHRADLEIVERAILEVAGRHEGEVTFVFMGCVTPNLLGIAGAEYVDFEAGYLRYAEKFQSLGVDVALVPLADNPFNRAKSPIKWLEYSACAIPGVYSDLPPYRPYVRDGENGCLVPNETGAWVSALERLVADAELRRRMGAAARRDVLAAHLVSTHSGQIVRVIREALGEDQGTAGVAIVIPTFNRHEDLGRCLAALRRHTDMGRCEVVVVDNGSDPPVTDVLSPGEQEGLVILRNAENLGFARACNQGAAAASADRILFLNNDTEVQAGWLEPLMRVLDRDPGVAAVGAKLLYPNGTLQHAGVAVTRDERAGDPLLPQHVFRGLPADFPEANRPRTCQALTAACLLVRRSAFEEVGGFDEGYWNGYEDVDLCFKLRQTGRRLVYQPESVVVHHESQSGPERFSRAAENIARLHEKWLGRVEPDLVVSGDGTLRPAAPGAAADYRPPDGKPAPAEPAGEGGPVPEDLVSIVILTYNQLRYTKRCVESLEAHTPEPHEVIFVDNGSTDGTRKWLARRVKRHPRWRLVANEKNLGFSKGCNQGIQAARGRTILLLNNDVVVTEGWLSGLLECLESAPDVGIVGPMTNEISGPQRVPEPGYRTLEELPAYAAAFREAHRHRRIPCRRIVGFCMLFRRELVERIGPLDERFGTGNFEDDDFCLRAAVAGYRNLIAGDVFIHHYGSRSFAGNRVDYASSMAGNRDRFREKWERVNLAEPQGRAAYCNAAVERAEFLAARGDLKAALERLQEAVDRVPDDPILYDRLCGLLVQGGLHRQALEILDALPAAVAARPDFLLHRAAALEGLERPEEAGEIADRVLSEDPDNAPAWNIKGLAAYRSGDAAEAEDCFRRAIAADPGFGLAHSNLGTLLWSSDRRDEGRALIERAFMLDPTHPDILANFQDLMDATGDLASAAGTVSEAVALHPHHKALRYLLVRALAEAGRAREAAEAAAEGLLLFGMDDEALAVARGLQQAAREAETGEGGPVGLTLAVFAGGHEATLGPSLMSGKGLADETLVVDAGASGRCLEIAEALGARVVRPGEGEGPLAAAARAARGRWLLLLRGDEVLSPQDHPAVRKACRNGTGKPGAAYVLPVRRYLDRPDGRPDFQPGDGRYPLEEAGSGWRPDEAARLVPRTLLEGLPGGPEHIDEALRDRGIPTATLQAVIHHYGEMGGRSAREA
ncbi:glycosyltransferase [Dissulfurirhabdus thermomarina]